MLFDEERDSGMPPRHNMIRLLIVRNNSQENYKTISMDCIGVIFCKLISDNFQFDEDIA